LHCSTTVFAKLVNCLVLLSVQFCAVCISMFFYSLVFFYTKMLYASCDSRQCRTKSNTAEQNFTISTLLY